MIRKLIFLVTFVASVSTVWAQEEKEVEEKEIIQEDSTLARSAEPKQKQPTLQAPSPTDESEKRPPISEYKIISFYKDTTLVDTSLTIQKDYKFNYLRKDDYGLQPINNVGRSYNSLIKVEEYPHVLPLFAARARHFNFMEVEDISYYRVPTPLTELYFKTTFEQGQQLDAFFTINTSPRLNLSMAYKGVRSLGKYKHALTSSGNLRSTLSYNTKNERYYMRTHFVAQDLMNQENGGISFAPELDDDSIETISGIDRYLGIGLSQEDFARAADRSSIDVSFQDAENKLIGRRGYLDHHYAIIKGTDSSRIAIRLGHIMDMTDKSYEYVQSAANELFGLSYKGTSRSGSKVKYENFSNQLYAEIANKYLGKLRVIGGIQDYNYGYNTILTQVDEVTGARTDITNRVLGEVTTIGGSYQLYHHGVDLKADVLNIISGDFEGHHANASLGYHYKGYGLQLGYQDNSVAPNFNFLLYQNDYVNYNWQRIGNSDPDLNFKNTETQKISLRLRARNFLTIEVDQTTIDNYAYFTKNEDLLTVPEQYDQSVELLKAQVSSNLKFKWFGVDNTITYQNVSSGSAVYKVPEIITRNSLYYQDHWFKKALFLQVGATFKYYSSYIADGYDPVLSEFYVQSESEQQLFKELGHRFGGFPQVDVFFNAKVRQTRIFFKVENFNEAFKQNNEFSAPGYATRDAVIRFGLVWNFFL